MSKEITEVYESMKNSEGMKFIYRRNLYSASFNIFEGNTEELENNLAVIERPKALIRDQVESNRNNTTHTHRKINRRFHNFLASAKTFVEHTRVFIEKHYQNTSIQSAYQSKIKSEFAEDELCRFIQDLRNFILHCGLPENYMITRLNQNTQEVESSVNLEVDKLLCWNKWSSISRNFLKKNDKSITFSSIVTPYANKIISLYLWLDSELLNYHETDLREYEGLKARFNSLKSET
jgi:hypothetical protein